MSNKKVRFGGEKIDVDWDGGLCIHIGECGDSTGDLFIGGRDPWCLPDLVSVDDVIDIVKRCPSGALSFESEKEDSILETAETENTVVVSYNGPYFVRGDLDIKVTTETELSPALKFRAALCRCGASKNKPFCDNSHESIGFKDYGAVGDKGQVPESNGGKLSITPVEDGPLILSGNILMQNGSGRVAWQGSKTALCRCGASKNKPFCDGSHVSAGFKSEV